MNAMTATRTNDQSASIPTLRVAPLSSTLGARIEGIDLAERQSDEEIAAIRRALLRYEVLFFDDQTLTPAQLRDFAARFGELHVHPIRPHIAGVPEVTLMQNQGAVDDSGNWRSDVTFIDTPPMACLLYAFDTPNAGGDTIWASTRAAYESFSQPVKNFLAPLIASHDFERSYTEERFQRMDLGTERFAWARRDHPPTTHPVVRTHPETGLNSLFVNPAFTTRILGLSHSESRKFLELIFEQIQQPQFLVRRQWKSGTVAFWDNRVTQHYTVGDYPANERVMYRLTILGDKPFHRSAK
jgi:taurine dioxygenase